ncbi:hypothetical protein D9M69_623810 [compost metagenome]
MSGWAVAAVYFQALCSRFCIRASTRAGSARACSPGSTDQATVRCGCSAASSSNRRVAIALRLTGSRRTSPRAYCESLSRPSINSPIFLLAAMMRCRWVWLAASSAGLSSCRAWAKPLMMRSGERRSCATA